MDSRDSASNISGPKSFEKAQEIYHTFTASGHTRIRHAKIERQPSESISPPPAKLMCPASPNMTESTVPLYLSNQVPGKKQTVFEPASTEPQKQE